MVHLHSLLLINSTYGKRSITNVGNYFRFRIKGLNKQTQYSNIFRFYCLATAR